MGRTSERLIEQEMCSEYQFEEESCDEESGVRMKKEIIIKIKN